MRWIGQDGPRVKWPASPRIFYSVDNGQDGRHNGLENYAKRQRPARLRDQLVPESGQDFFYLRHVRYPLSVHDITTRRIRPDRTTRAFQRRYVPCRVAILFVRMATFFPVCRRYYSSHQWQRTTAFLLNLLA